MQLTKAENFSWHMVAKVCIGQIYHLRFEGMGVYCAVATIYKM